MATAAVKQPVQPSGNFSKWVFIAAVVLLVALNAAYLLFLRSGGSGIESKTILPDTSVVQAVPLGGGRLAALTNDSRLVLYDGQTVTAAKPFTLTYSVLATTPDQSKIIGGSSSAQVTIWDAQLNEVGGFRVNGRVTGLGVNNAGNIGVSHSVGQFTGRAFVSLRGPNGEPIFRQQTGIDANALAIDDKNIYIGTIDGKVIALSQEDGQSGGKELWRTTLLQPVVELSLTSKGQLLAGDERGAVTLLNPDGKIAWQRSLSEYRVRMLHDDPATGLILTSDADGNLFVLRPENGEAIYQTHFSNGAIKSFLRASPSSVSLADERGGLVSLNLSAVLGAQRQGTIDTFWLISNLVLGVTALAALVAALPRTRGVALDVGKRIKNSRTAYVLILPAMLLIVVFAYVPTVMGLYYSFTNFNLSEPLKFIGLDNFSRLLRDQFFWIGVGNMVLLLITGIIKTLTIPLLVAELVFWLTSNRLKYALRTAFIVPSIVPGVVAVLLWKQMYDPNIGLINEFLRNVGLSEWTRAWLADEKIAIWSIIFSGFPWIGAFSFLIYYGGLLNINRELFDAAAIDGATAWQRFTQVDLPLLRPQLRLLLFFAFLGGAQEFGNIYIFTRGGPGTATYVPGLQMFLKISAAEYGYASAIGFVLALAVAVVTVTRFRFNQTPDMA